MNLDQPESYAQVDTTDALGDLEAMAEQWRAARVGAADRLALDGLRTVVVAGMGGSGITGDVVRTLADGRLALPVVVHKGYGMPGWVGPQTLVLAVSCSGGTEETLAAVEEAASRGARLAAISSGGRLSERAREDGFPLYEAKGGLPPRHSIGMLAAPALGALGLDEDLDEALAAMEQVIAACRRDVPTAENPAKRLGAQLGDGRPLVIWGTQGLAEVAAYRFHCQLNENAKLPSIVNVLPELDHNEVVGWQEAPVGDGFAGLAVLRDPDGEPEPVTRRVEPSVAAAREHVDWVEQLHPQGQSRLARLVTLMLLGDFASVYAALALDRDPTPIPSIDALKAELAR
ncbi:MAG: bifunctional phosphoglucose/phosphomannose isomerase [Egibacteraceae bacterium]